MRPGALLGQSVKDVKDPCTAGNRLNRRSEGKNRRRCVQGVQGHARTFLISRIALS
jgi:hypothetical protein